MPEMVNAATAADLLGVDKRTVLRLARAAKIRSYRTPGGQHRFRREDVENLAAGEGHATTARSVASPLENKRQEIESLALDVQARRAKRDLQRLEAEDAAADEERAEARRQEESARQAEQEQRREQARAEAEKRARELAGQQAARQRREWEAKITDAALAKLPRDIPLDVRAAAGEAVHQALAKLDLADSPQYGATVLALAISSALAPWERRKEIERTVASTRERIPPLGRGIVEPTDWEIKAQRAAADAIRQLAPDAALAEVRAAAIEAGNRVAADYECWKAQDDHRRACEQVVEWIFDGDEARAAVRKALEKLPLGASHSEMEKTRDTALRPFEAREKAERDADRYLPHVAAYIEELGAPDGEWDLGDWSQRRKLTDRLKRKIKIRLVAALLACEIEDDEDAQEFIEAEIDAELEDE